jgi:hypothetical protein
MRASNLGQTFLQVLCVALATALAPAVARADASLGSLTVPHYEISGRGVEITANYTIDPDTLCPCPPEDMRWLQLIHLTDNAGNDKTFLPEFPNATFIDPQPGADIGGGPADSEPWYDPTYNNDPLGPGGGGAIQNGAGPWLYDRPQFLAGDAPMRFDAFTLVVCIDEDTDTAKMLGGFQWGFTLSNPGPTTGLLPIQPLTDSQALRDMFNLGAGRLESVFDWHLAEQDDPDCVFDTSTVPEPASLSGLVLLTVFVGRRSRRARAA